MTGVKTNPAYESFIDWLKFLGTCVIVYGHVAAWSAPARIAPIYSKQLGVAFFVFVAGFSLAREARPKWQVVANRLFEVYLFGIALAVLVSCVSFLAGGRGQLSNYAPFVFGVNVTMNSFPANPTTWYVGTYLHLIVLWALVFSRWRVSVLVFVVACVAEVIIRAVLLNQAGGFVAYMSLPNWLTAFLLGRLIGQKQRQAGNLNSRLTWSIVLVAWLVLWALATSRLSLDPQFPFMLLTMPGLHGAMLTSLLISGVYLSVTWLMFMSTRDLAAPSIVRFVARNSLIIFLAHMPLVNASEGFLRLVFGSRTTAAAVLFVICIIGLGSISEWIHRVINVRRWRDMVSAALVGRVA